MAEIPDWVPYAQRLQAITQAGFANYKDKYSIERLKGALLQNEFNDIIKAFNLHYLHNRRVYKTNCW